MFPTTIWTTVHAAGGRDADALQRFAERYRPVIRGFIGRRVNDPAVADDLCQDVFVRLLAGDVLAKADPTRGRLRSLLLTISARVVADHLRRRARDRIVQAEAPEPAARDPDFDKAWILHLAEEAMLQLESVQSPYHAVLRDHLAGQKQNRKRLYHARRRLIALIRSEIAMTCSSHREFEEETAYLSPYLRPSRAHGKDRDAE